MRDAYMTPDLATILRRYEQRIEALEMSQRVVRGATLISMFPQAPAMYAPASIAPQGAAAFYTSFTFWQGMLSGDFVATGTGLDGKLYHFVAAGHTFDLRVQVAENGSGLAYQTVYEETGVSAIGDGSYWDTTIPPTAYLGDDIRGLKMRMNIDVRLTSGTDAAGVAISEVPNNYPET
jgi:hypothetical protein